jgi:hypothetical protein
MKYPEDLADERALALSVPLPPNRADPAGETPELVAGAQPLTKRRQRRAHVAHREGSHSHSPDCVAGTRLSRYSLRYPRVGGHASDVGGSGVPERQKAIGCAQYDGLVRERVVRRPILRHEPVADVESVDRRSNSEDERHVDDGTPGCGLQRSLVAPRESGQSDDSIGLTSKHETLLL